MLTSEAIYHNTDIILIANTISQEPSILKSPSINENDILTLLMRSDLRELVVSIFLKKNKDLLYINSLLSNKETITAIVHAINSKKLKSVQLY